MKGFEVASLGEEQELGVGRWEVDTLIWFSKGRLTVIITSGFVVLNFSFVRCLYYVFHVSCFLPWLLGCVNSAQHLSFCPLHRRLKFGSFRVEPASNSMIKMAHKTRCTQTEEKTYITGKGPATYKGLSTVPVPQC